MLIHRRHHHHYLFVKRQYESNKWITFILLLMLAKAHTTQMQTIRAKYRIIKRIDTKVLCKERCWQKTHIYYKQIYFARSDRNLLKIIIFQQCFFFALLFSFVFFVILLFEIQLQTAQCTFYINVLRPVCYVCAVYCCFFFLVLFDNDLCCCYFLSLFNDEILTVT